MKFRIGLFLTIMFFAFGLTFSQTADLVLQSDVTQAYEASLWVQEAECNTILQNPAADPLTMRTYVKRAIIHMALIQVDSKMYGDSIKIVLDSLDNNNERIESFFEDNLESIRFNNVDSMLIDLRDLFLDPRYTDLKNELENLADQYNEDAEDLGNTLDSLFTAYGDHLQIIIDDLAAVRDSSVAFDFSVQIIGAKSEDIMVFHEDDFYDMDSLIQYTSDGIDYFGEGIENLHSLQNNEVLPEDVVGNFRSSIESFNLGLDNLDSLLTTDPILILELDTVFISEIRDFLSETDSVLAGKEFEIDDAKTIRPIALIENPIENFWDFIKDFYITENPNTYTFGNLFPLGLPQDIVNQLGENMIVNNNDNENATEQRMHDLKNGYLDALAVNPDSSAAHLGLAITMTYLFAQELGSELADFIAYMDSADFREDFIWTQVNNTEIADSISFHFQQAKEDDNLIFTILMINDSEGEIYSISPETEFEPVFIINPQLEIVDGIAYQLAETRDAVAEVFETIYSELDSMFVLDLDPNFLDFSNAENEMDVLNILEQSNPDFLNIKPYGEEKFLEAGDELRDAFSKFTNTTGHFSEFIDAMAMHEDDLDIDGEEMKNFAYDLDEFINEVNTDFQVAESTTWFNDERVNLSAWFDNPPDILLQRLKWYFDDDEDTDNTLGGLFPDRGFGTFINYQHDNIPVKHHLSQNYPNPFNPVTTIQYSLPEATNVVMTLHNVLGQKVKTLLNEVKKAGHHKVIFNAESLSSGIYFYKLQTESFSAYKKCLLMK